MNTGNHGINNEQIPPSSAPALFQDGESSSVEGCKRPGIEANLQGKRLSAAQNLPGLVIFAAAIEGYDEKHHGLHDESIFKPLGLVNKAIGLLKEALPRIAGINI